VLRSHLRRPFDDVTVGLENLVALPRPYLALAISLLSMTATWFVYVPIHELLHVAGCLWTGGAVSELELRPEYGGALLAAVFDFVVVGGEYSGRLSGFDTHGSDLIYLATDFAPYLLSVFIGVPLLQLCRRRARPILFGPAIVVGLAPFYNFIGDYYEMGSIVVTRVLTWLTGGAPTPIFESLRSDDVAGLIGRMASAPGELGLGSSGALAVGSLVVTLALLASVALAFLSYGLGAAFSDAVLGVQAQQEPADASPPDEQSP
jgi:hypothetical protein